MAEPAMYLRVGLITFALGFVVDVISYGSPYWYTGTDSVHGGLWLICLHGECFATPDNIGGTFHGVQALMSLGLISAIFGIFAACSLYKGLTPIKLRLLQSFSVIAGALTLIGASVFFGRILADDSWAAYLGYPAAFLYLLAGLFVYLYIRTSSTYQSLP